MPVRGNGRIEEPPSLVIAALIGPQERSLEAPNHREARNAGVRWPAHARIAVSDSHGAPAGKGDVPAHTSAAGRRRGRRPAAASLEPDYPSVGISETSSICIQVSWKLGGHKPP